MRVVCFAHFLLLLLSCCYQGWYIGLLRAPAAVQHSVGGYLACRVSVYDVSNDCEVPYEVLNRYRHAQEAADFWHWQARHVQLSVP